MSDAIKQLTSKFRTLVRARPRAGDGVSPLRDWLITLCSCSLLAVVLVVVGVYVYLNIKQTIAEEQVAVDVMLDVELESIHALVAQYQRREEQFMLLRTASPEAPQTRSVSGSTVPRDEAGASELPQAAEETDDDIQEAPTPQS